MNGKITLLTQLFPDISLGEQRELVLGLIGCLPSHDDWAKRLEELRTIVDEARDEDLLTQLEEFRTSFFYPFAESAQTLAYRCIDMLANLWTTRDTDDLYEHFEWFMEFSERICNNSAHLERLIRSAYAEAGRPIPEWAE